MKKIVLAIIIGALVGAGFFYLKANTNGLVPTAENSNVKSETEDIRLEDKPVVIEHPTRLRIPSLSVNASVEHVGLDSQKRMDVPKSYHNVAWYELGFMPGETGSAVIAGHFNTPSGSPGVFYDIEDLAPGDEIIIEGDNKALTYIVTETATFPFDEVPLREIFDSRDAKRLNLITCEGIFDSASKNYSERLIVYAVLEEEQ